MERENQNRQVDPERDRAAVAEQEYLNASSATGKDTDRDAFVQIARIIATIDIPLSKDHSRELSPGETPNTPDHWISNYAEGLARSGTVTQEQAITGVRAAFESRYGMSPEAYAERYDPSSAKSPADSAKDRAFKKAAKAEADHTHEQERGHDPEHDPRKTR